MTSSSSTRLTRRRCLLLAAGLGGTALAYSMRPRSKSDLTRRLRALPKNAALPAPESLGLGGGPDSSGVFLRCAPDSAPAPRRRPVVLIAPTPSTCFTFAPLMLGASDSAGARRAGLAAERAVYALEMPGHGIAPKTHEPVTFQRCADHVVAMLDALQLERVHLVGASYGGEFAWRAALDHPERFASLTLLDSAGVQRREADWLSEEVAMREWSVARYGWLLNSRSRIESALRPHFDRIPEDSVEEVFLCCSNAGNWSAMVDLARDENGDRQRELAQIQPPTLLGWGARDLAYEPSHYAAAFEQAIPNAQLHLFEDTGHYPHEERPVQVLQRLEEHFTQVEGS